MILQIMTRSAAHAKWDHGHAAEARGDRGARGARAGAGRGGRRRGARAARHGPVRAGRSDDQPLRRADLRADPEPDPGRVRRARPGGRLQPRDPARHGRAPGRGAGPAAARARHRDRVRRGRERPRRPRRRHRDGGARARPGRRRRRGGGLGQGRARPRPAPVDGGEEQPRQPRDRGRGRGPGRRAAPPDPAQGAVALDAAPPLDVARGARGGGAAARGLGGALAPGPRMAADRARRDRRPARAARRGATD